MEAKHTPGPWVAVYDGWLEGANGQNVCAYEGCGSHTAEWANPADKQLALASPELLEALEMVSDYITTMKGAGHEYTITVRAAIAKATRSEV